MTSSSDYWADVTFPEGVDPDKFTAEITLPGEVYAESCRVCGEQVVMICQGSTGYCCQNCERLAR